MGLIGTFCEPDALGGAIEAAAAADEATVVAALLHEADFGPEARRRIAERATDLVVRIRAAGAAGGGLDAFLHTYDLSSREGVMLMCLAEALLRVPDAATADKLIADKIGGADWQRHIGESASAFVNASTWALMLTGRVLRMDPAEVKDPGSFLKRLVARSGEAVIRQAMIAAMRILGRQFVMGRTISEALARSREDSARGSRHSFDMLGESAVTAADADRYFAAYGDAIAAVGRESAGRGPFAGPGVSIKLSALHPRFEFAQRQRVIAELLPRVRALARQAKAVDIGLCVDTEESERLSLTLELIEAVFAEPDLAPWEGLGMALQAYQKRARSVVDWLAALARRQGRRLSLRLVKGAYWDAEIKRAQMLGLAGYPVFTRKVNTDVSYIACARAIFAAGDAFYPQFATHNAQTLASVIELAGGRGDYEFQRLHGMGEALSEALAASQESPIPFRIYAPVGSHKDLLAYLVRRLLENGSNTSFVNRIVDASLPVAAIVADPKEKAAALLSTPHPRVPSPRRLFGDERLAAKGIDLSDAAEVRSLAAALDHVPQSWSAAPMVAGEELPRPGARAIFNPSRHREKVGEVTDANAATTNAAVASAQAAFADWQAAPVEDRAACLERAANALEQATPELMALLIREAGKTIADAAAEVVEAVDFCRYYAAQARSDFANARRLPGPTGESNSLSWHGRGVFACISPWNFPLAIFVGQVAAALAAGNSVVAKPAEQTPLIAARAVRLLHQAGIPPGVVNLLPGDGAVGAAMVADPRIAGVAFTGSYQTAKAIAGVLAGRLGAIVPLIAETGGLNAMIVDSTALPEQVVSDVVASAFRSAGQRCSALRVLFVQQEIAPKLEKMLEGAVAELKVGDPAHLSTDIGPVIDAAALAMLREHAARMDREARPICRARLSVDAGDGYFFAPVVYALDRLDRLEREIFGPILHLIPFAADRLEQVVDEINATGYGLTFGIHSRVEQTVHSVWRRLRVGNAYVNRNMIGARVGVQPFGGEGLSGTGPKAGGPYYLHRFAVERTLCINTAAAGGNAELLAGMLDDEA